MWRPARLDVTTAAGALAVGGALTAAQSQGFPELVFYVVLLILLAVVGRVVARAWRSAREERERAAALVATEPASVARVAVQEERRRLEAEIAGTLRGSLVRIRAYAADAVRAPDPSSALRRIHHESQGATSELRRHLGLLRESPPTSSVGAPDKTATPRGDLVLAVAVSVLAAVESTAYSIGEGPSDWSWWSVVLSTLAAASVVGRTVALPAAAAACGGCYLLGALAGVPVVNGFWTIGAVGVLAWTVAARPHPGRADLVGDAALIGSVTIGGWLADRDNVAVLGLVLAVATVAGLLTGRAGRRAAAAAAVASVRQEELQAASQAAVHAERGVVARDLHDVVSHAVGLIAVQAAAAQVSWPQDPATVRSSLDLIEATAETALSELGRLRPDEPPARSVEDLRALVARIRAAGTAVELAIVGDPPPGVLPVVYRVVQEALTNVVRHAPGAAVTVTVGSDEGQTWVQVVDDGPGGSAAGPRGFGLVGLAERVAFAGGTLKTGPGPDGGGFRVEAVLPVRADVVAS